MDAELRRSERASLTDPSGRVRLLRTRLRSGALAPAQAELAAYAGDAAARAIIDPDRSPLSFCSTPFASWELHDEHVFGCTVGREEFVQGLRLWEGTSKTPLVTLRALCLAARAAWTVHVRLDPRETACSDDCFCCAYLRAIEAVEARIVCACSFASCPCWMRCQILAGPLDTDDGTDRPWHDLCVAAYAIGPSCARGWAAGALEGFYERAPSALSAFRASLVEQAWEGSWMTS